MNRQVQALQIGSGRHDNVADPLQSVRERRDSAAQHRGVRARPRGAEPQFVANAGRDVRIDVDDAIDAVCVRQYGFPELAIAVQFHRPTGKRPLAGILDIVEVGVIPG